MKRTAVIILGLMALLAPAQARVFTSFHYGWGCSPWHSSYFYRPHYAYPAYYYSWGYEPAYVYTRPNYAVSGTLLGALAGGLIGHAAGRHGLEGAAIGAASGLFVGAAAEHSARRREYNYATTPVGVQTTYESSAQPAVTEITAQAVAPPRRSERISPASNPMSDANRLFGR